MGLTTSAKRALALASDCPACPSGPGTECPPDGRPRLDGLHDARWEKAVPDLAAPPCPECGGWGFADGEPCPRGCLVQLIELAKAAVRED
jgi:hypothetical protein